ncbi:MAG: SUMF1/EgtB/PvdO family nonheme iron enzyme [Candidatus Riflebacteria bacterium]|nr:SUMF1/EgtB/PvdO family nonheme iron enzyme [Candidatus Riflebacteria bacterium]
MRLGSDEAPGLAGQVWYTDLAVETHMEGTVQSDWVTITASFSLEGSPYEIEGLLGRGRTAVVLKAISNVTRTAVALKVLKPHVAREQEWLQRFFQEAEVLSRIVHPGIVRVLDHGKWHVQHYIALELVAGTTLAARLARGAGVPWREACAIARDVAGALVELHGHGICHRDLKPSNIFLTESGAAKIADFGLIRVEGAKRITAPRMILGTPLYTSPEQIRTEPGDGRSDLYSLGIILAEMLMGHPPYHSTDVIKVSKMHLESPLPIQEDFPPDVPAGLVDLVQSLMAKSAADRPQQAPLVVSGLTRILDESDPTVSQVAATAPVSAAPGALVVDSQPRGARILLGAERRDTGHLTPTSFDRIPSGQVSVELALGGHRPFVAEVHVGPGELSYLQAMMEVDMGDMDDLAGVDGLARKGKNGQGYLELLNEKDGTVLVLIPEGDSVQGSDGEDPVEQPAHRVSLSRFLLGRHPVTVAQYLRFVLETGHRAPASDGAAGNPLNLWTADGPVPGTQEQPVVNVSWDDAIAYAAWAGGRLPTEAEWERAARDPSGSKYPWGDQVPDGTRACAGRTWSGPGTIEPVDRLAPGASPWGCEEMVGTVWEWCQDWFDPACYLGARDKDPVGPSRGWARVIKGGSWAEPLASLRSSRRSRARPGVRSAALGFRLCRPLPGAG